MGLPERGLGSTKVNGEAMKDSIAQSHEIGVLIRPPPPDGFKLRVPSTTFSQTHRLLGLLGRGQVVLGQLQGLAGQLQQKKGKGILS